MGLTGGLVDVGELFDCLAGIHGNRADPDILDKYDQIRREKYEKFTLMVSESFLKRMASDPDEVEANDPGIAAMREADKTDEASVAFQLVSCPHLVIYGRSSFNQLLVGGVGVGTRYDSVLQVTVVSLCGPLSPPS